MPEFLQLLSPDEARQRFLGALSQTSRMESERVPTETATGRILSEQIFAPEALPPFPRTTVDGYALRAEDTHGASPGLPAYLQLVGEIPMGAQSTITIQPNQAALVHTGGMIPENANAVVMLEDTQTIQADEIEVFRPIGVGENILKKGEDVQSGSMIFELGHRLRPQAIGGLMALGITEIQVARRPRVGILSTGDELASPRQALGPGQVRDVNSYTLSALVTEAGGEPIQYGIIPDDYSKLLEAVRASHKQDQIVVVTAGSSVSTRDMTAQAIHELGPPGILVHGISIKPGKPTILALADKSPVIGLPGNPVSALVIARLILIPLIHVLLGIPSGPPQATIKAQIAANIASETGREDYIPVSLEEKEGRIIAHPVYGRSNLIFTLVRADGLVRIPSQATGIPAEHEVEVIPI